MSGKKKNNNKSALDIRLDAKMGAERHEPEHFPLPTDEFIMPVPQAEDEQPSMDTPTHGSELEGAKPDEAAVRIPEEQEDPADMALAEMAADSVRSFYTFINLASLLIAVLIIALTLLLIREGERYSADNIQLTAETFLDGSYTASLSNRYINEMKLDGVIGKLSSAMQKLYGFGSEAPLKPVIPDTFGNIDNNKYTQTTTERRLPEETTSSLSQSSTVSVNASVSGAPVTMPTVTIDVESDFTGVIKHTTTTTTTSITTTAKYSYTATGSVSETTTTTAPLEVTPTQTQTTTDTATETTVVSSETEPLPSETEPEETSADTNAPDAAEGSERAGEE